MDPRITVSVTALVATLLAVYVPTLGDSGAAQIAALIVTFVVGWLTRTPGSTPPAAPKADATFPAGRGR